MGIDIKTGILIYLLILPVSACNLGVVLETEQNQRMGVEVPLIANNTSGGPVPIFLAIDRISTEKDDEINFVFVCRNEGNFSGDNECVFSAGTYEGCPDRKDINGGIDSPGGITVCRGSFDVEEEIYLSPYASNGSVKNSLLFKIPYNEKKNGIIVIFNSPDLSVETNLSRIRDYHPLITGPNCLEDYGNYDWVLTNLKGFKDQKGDEIEKYVVNTKAFLLNEKAMVWDYFSTNKISYEISEPKKSKTINNTQFWIQKIIVNNTANFDFFDIPVVFKINLTIKNNTLESSENLTNLNLTNSTISFIIPKIKSNSNNIYEINYGTEIPKTEKTNENSTMIKFSMSGNIIYGLGNFFDSFFNKKDLNEGLVLYLNFEEGNGNITHDNSSFGNNGTIHGNPRWAVGKKGLGLEFDGVDDYVDLEKWQTPFTDKNYTISLWVYIDEFPENNTFNYIFWRNDDAPSIRFNRNGTNLAFLIDGNHRQGFNLDTISSDYIGKWNHLVITYDGTTEKVYVNSELKGEKEVTMEHYLDSRTVILGWDGAKNRALNGKLDEIKVYNKILTEEEIKALYMGCENSFLFSFTFNCIFLSCIIGAVLIVSYIEFKVRNKKVKVKKQKYEFRRVKKK